jgi:hypothetical protein
MDKGLCIPGSHGRRIPLFTDGPNGLLFILTHTISVYASFKSHIQLQTQHGYRLWPHCDNDESEGTTDDVITILSDDDLLPSSDDPIYISSDSENEMEVSQLEASWITPFFLNSSLKIQYQLQEEKNVLQHKLDTLVNTLVSYSFFNYPSLHYFFHTLADNWCHWNNFNMQYIEGYLSRTLHVCVLIFHFLHPSYIIHRLPNCGHTFYGLCLIHTFKHHDLNPFRFHGISGVPLVS